MNRKRVFFAVIAVLAWLTVLVEAAPGNRINKETFVFAVKGTDTLKLDKYEAGGPAASRLKPVILFAFGGGFKGGDRASKAYLPYFNFLADNGYIVVSTDYRTGLKGLSAASLATPDAFATALQQAVSMAVEDFFDATRFVLGRCQAWRADPERVVASGSSAGAITSLQAEYELCNRTGAAGRLPAAFNYAGVIAFAGAIASVGEPVWKTKPCPLMMFHGDADRTVPFEKAVIDGAGLWGSAFIAEQLNGLEVPYFFCQVANAGHEIAVKPLSANRYDVLTFLTRLVVAKENLVITEIERVPGQPEVKKDFSVSDYLQSNLE